MNSKLYPNKIRLIDHPRKAKKLNRPAHPDDIFIATHKKKNGEWVDVRATETHKKFCSSLTQVGGDVEGSTRIQIWKEVVGGKTRGRCYGTVQLARNIRYGVNFLTQVSVTNPYREADNKAIEAVRAEAAAAREEVTQANAWTNELAKKFDELSKKFDMLHSLQASSSSAPVNGHSDYNKSEEEDYDDDEEEVDVGYNA